MERIRARQGHSRKEASAETREVDHKEQQKNMGRSLLTEDRAPLHLTHGTYHTNLASIIETGLKLGGLRAGSRLENHFATVTWWSEPSVPGYRPSAEIGMQRK